MSNCKLPFKMYPCMEEILATKNMKKIVLHRCFNECTQHYSTIHAYIMKILRKMVFCNKNLVFLKPAIYYAVLQQPFTISIAQTP